jgi:hypothetical protein
LAQVKALIGNKNMPQLLKRDCKTFMTMVFRLRTARAKSRER